jgi:hypothetical protein
MGKWLITMCLGVVMVGGCVTMKDAAAGFGTPCKDAGGFCGAPCPEGFHCVTIGTKGCLCDKN